MNFAHFSVTRPVAVTMRIAALVLLGAICATRLPIDLLPKVSIPTVAIITVWPNVAPEEIEAQVTRPLEQALSSVPNLYQITSNTQEGQCMVRVQFQWGTDIGQAAVEVQQLVGRARQRFPVDPTLQTPVVYRFDPSQMPILIYGVRGEQDPVKLRQVMDNQVSPIIESANGVGSAVVTGGQQRAILIEADPTRLRAHHFTLQDIVRRISQENVNVPAGIAKQGDTELVIRSLGWFTDPADIARLPLGIVNGQTVTIGQVASIRDNHAETRLYTRLNGEPAVGLIIRKQSEANTVTTARAVQEKIRQVNRLFPNLEFMLAYDQAQFIEGSIDEVTESAMIGGVLAILILLFFLRNFRSTFVVALSIPISIISTFGLLYVCGFTLNTMTLGGLALATGLIVDDAVVVLENIFRHIERDKKRPAEAAVSGTMEILSAVVASTLTIIVVFLPLLLIQGQAGQMFTQFALVVIFSLLVSLLDAATVVPMLASRVIQGEAHHEDNDDGHRRNWVERRFHRFGQILASLDQSYRTGLKWSLRHRFALLGGAAVVSAAGFLLVPLLGSELMPQTDSGDFTVRVKMPPGTSLERTDRAMKQIESIVLADPNVNTAFASAGTTLRMGRTTALAAYEGSVSVKLKDERRRSTSDVVADLRKKLGQVAGARANINQTDMVTWVMTGGPQNIEVNIMGDDLQTLSALGREVSQKLRSVAGLEGVDTNWQDAMPELQWKVDREKALKYGLSFSDIASSINTATNGTIASYYQEKGFQYPILVQLPMSERKTEDKLDNLVISSKLAARPDGTAVPGPDILLSQVAVKERGVGPSEITRQERQRFIGITGQPVGRSASEVQADIEKVMKGVKLPPGYYWDWGVQQKRRAEEYAGMTLAIVLAIGLIYMLLASQFESFVHPLTVLTSVPLSAVGVILALFLSGRAFGLTAFIGLLMLVGIVVKNGILLVDYTNVLRSRGYSRDEALLTAGPTRLRPILMTSSAAILGMLPLAVGLGQGSETQAPMATAVIGGLFTSTLLTLFVVPTVYALFDDLARFARRDQRDLAHAALIEPSVGAVERLPGAPPVSQSPEPGAADRHAVGEQPFERSGFPPKD